MTTSAPVGVATAIVLAAPGLAWVALISWSGGDASDAQHVGWFVVVGASCVVAGTLLPVRVGLVAVVAVAAWVAAVGTLFLWWSSVDSSGLFMVGVVLAALPMALTAPLLVLAGARARHAVSAPR